MKQTRRPPRRHPLVNDDEGGLGGWQPPLPHHPHPARSPPLLKPPAEVDDEFSWALDPTAAATIHCRLGRGGRSRRRSSRVSALNVMRVESSSHRPSRHHQPPGHVWRGARLHRGRRQRQRRRGRDHERGLAALGSSVLCNQTESYSSNNLYNLTPN
jgi:hypothetical protein